MLSNLTKLACAARRDRLLQRLEHPALLFTGAARARNYRANTFPFRASSHALYFMGTGIEGSVMELDPTRGATLFVHDPGPDDALWHGPSPTLEELGTQLGFAVRPLDQLVPSSTHASLPHPASEVLAQQTTLLCRTPSLEDARDRHLAEAVLSLRLVHDSAAIEGLTRAAEATALAHRAGMIFTRPGQREWQVKAAMLSPLHASHCGVSYEPIVTTHGEVLHNHAYGNTLGAADLLLADVGAETSDGWAGDVTRTWPVGGRFSGTQRAVYEVVLRAQEAAIEALRPGVRYRDVHLRACLTLAEGLVELGWLRGAKAADLVEVGAHALFFPHGIGHLLGLDVHDMEDLGDLAGYAPGRTRSGQFGLGYLRLDRDLVAGMAVTIEPGLYVVPAILSAPHLSSLMRFVDRDRLVQFADVRGIRIEDDLLVTANGSHNLTGSIPKTTAEVEAAMGGGHP